MAGEGQAPRERGADDGSEHDAWAHGLAARPSRPSAWRRASDRFRRRLRGDLQFGAVMLFASVAILSVGPFAVYRVLIGELGRGLMNALLVLGVLALAGWAWRGHSARRPALVATVFHTTLAVVTAWRFGHDVLLWMHPIAIANYVLVGRRIASAVNLAALLALAALGPHPALYADMGQYAGFIASFVLVCALSLVFASLTAHQRRQLEAQVLVDPLTAAFNRRALGRELALVEARRDRLRESWGCAVIDLDHFKAVNDHFGHEVGDQVLVAFADLVRRRTRPTDRLFRLGGEEFALLVPGGDADTLRALAEKLCAAVRDELPLPGRLVTVSIGVAMLGAGEAPRAWMSRADAAAYRAKAAGRDRVEEAGPPG
jgi:diguanylate cyclase (GGDEF)-like protein